jgi:conjugal transfer/entry exclusion protein
LEPLIPSAEATSIPGVNPTPAPNSRLESFVDAQVVVTPIVVSGVVDAILEVSRQRKSLLDQLRSLLQSGNNAKALQLARQLCGLPG